MVLFANVQRQLPDIWVKQKGYVTARDAMQRYGFKSEAAAIAMLDNLVRDRRLIKTVENGVVIWKSRS